ncbi:hypothetical protein PMIN03_004659 [Paraphaeosphaeria minitans]
MNTILPEESPLHVADATKNRYIGITLAGKGSTAEVWYAIPRATLSGTDLPVDVVSLRSRVCAVKLYRLYASRIYIKNELPAIKRLQTLSGHLRARFTEPLDFSDEAEKDDPCWFAMKVVQGFTLTQLRKAIFLSKRTVPEEFVFHMYIQLHEALKFLHTSDPPMTKGDLVAVNIMIDPTTEDVPGFPNIKLIDFGGAQVGEVGLLLSDNAMDHEWYCIYRTIYDLAMLNLYMRVHQRLSLRSWGWKWAQLFPWNRVHRSRR